MNKCDTVEGQKKKKKKSKTEQHGWMRTSHQVRIPTDDSDFEFVASQHGSEEQKQANNTQ
jgi:hypothetical protein